MTRKLALEHLKVAIMQSDTKRATQLLIEQRISRKVYNQMWKQYGKNVSIGFSS